jgi:DNA-binding GntR family transcriptional regulator
VADAISSEILAAAFAPGDRLRESAIASQLGVSRNTVREAVRMLELGGLVQYEVNRGAVVISPTPQKVDDLYVARERLETAAVSRAPTPAGLQRLEEAFESLVRATEIGDAAVIVREDLLFHSTIVSFLGSSRLDEFYAELTRELRFYLMVLSVADREFEHPSSLVAEHLAVLSAVRSGKPRLAVKEVRHHIDTNAARLKEILAAREVE